jgi:hypothetical protein
MNGLVLLTPFETWTFIILLFLVTSNLVHIYVVRDLKKREVLRTRLQWQQLAREERAQMDTLNALSKVPHPDLYDYEKEEQKEQYVGALIQNGYTKEQAEAEFNRLWNVLTNGNKLS